MLTMQISLSCLFKYKKSLRIHERNDQMNITVFSAVFFFSLCLSLSEQKVPGSNPACAWVFSGSSHTSDLKIGTPVATLPDTWCYRVSTGTGWPGVSIL